VAKIVETAQLKPAQRVALDALRRAEATDLTRARYEELTGVSRSQAAYDLAELVEAGLLARIGAGRATRYRLAPAAESGRRRWTDDRIRAELASFCAGRTTWPSAAEFRSAGRSDLYVAASRYGGIGFWATELGFPRERERAARPLFGRRVALAVAAALVFALGAGVAALALRVHRHAAAPAPPPKATRAAGEAPAPATFLADVRSLRRARVESFAAQAAERAAASSRVVLVLRATRGESWISVRSAAGRLLAERLLAPAASMRLHGTALWVRLGAAANVDLSTNGSRLHPLPSRAAVVVVTPRGMRVAEWAPAPAPPASAPVLVVRRSPVPAPPPPPAPAPLPKPAKTTPTPKAPERTDAASSWPTPLPSP
jgi:DNA-binding transcriptional ArsR family regulator